MDPKNADVAPYSTGTGTAILGEPEKGLSRWVAPPIEVFRERCTTT